MFYLSKEFPHGRLTKDTKLNEKNLRILLEKIDSGDLSKAIPDLQSQLEDQFNIQTEGEEINKVLREQLAKVTDIFLTNFSTVPGIKEIITKYTGRASFEIPTLVKPAGSKFGAENLNVARITSREMFTDPVRTFPKESRDGKLGLVSYMNDGIAHYYYVHK